MNKKVAFISSYYGPYFSNYVASILELEKRLQTFGIESVYIFPIETKNFEWMKMLLQITSNIYFLEYKPYSISNILSIRKLIKQEKVNLIYSRMCGWDLTVRFACPFLPVVWHMDMNVNLTVLSKRIKNWIKFKFLGFGKTFHVAVSETVCNTINSLKPKNGCELIVNAIDFSRLKREFKTKDNGELKILVFGWSPYVKGVDIAVKACEFLVGNNEKITLYISSQSQTNDYFKEKYDNIPDWIKLIPPTDNISELYNNVDIMLSSSRSESFSYCIAEAIYMGLPVIFSDIPGTSWAKEFRNTFQYSVENVDELADLIVKCKNIKFDEEVLKYNISLMNKKYSIESWVNHEIEFINKI